MNKPILKKQVAPTTIKIELTEGCNLFCKFCAIKSIRSKPMQDLKFIKALTVRNIASKITSANLDGKTRIELAMHGEPLLHPNLFGILNILRKYLPKTSIMITSNGGPIITKNSNVEKILKYVNCLALDWYDGIKFVPTIIKKHIPDHTKINYYPDINIYQRFKPKDHHLVILGAINKYKLGTRTLHNTAGNSGRLDFSKSKQRCARPFRELTFTYDGSVNICCNDWSGSFKIGSIHKVKSLDGLWNHKDLISARKILFHEGRTFSICKGCNARSSKNGLLPDLNAKFTMEKPNKKDYDNVYKYKRKKKMKDVAFLILTRGRLDRQITYSNLPGIIKRHTYLVVDQDEDTKYSDKFQRIVFPKGFGNFLIDGSGNFSDKKQWSSEWCFKHGYKYMILLDDDLKFDCRRDGKLKPSTIVEITCGLYLLVNWLREGYSHVAMSPREGNNWEEKDFAEVGRAMRVCGFNLEIIRKHNLKFNRTILMADFDITLQLLELGYPNKISYKYANGQRKSNDDGGCSLYRTPERMREAALSLQKLHPKFVKVTEKKTSKPWAGFDTNVRTDVQISWKKAYEYGLAKKNKKKNISKFLKK